MRKSRDVTGMVFGRLTALEYAGRSKNRSFLWKCRCECGVETIAMLAKIMSGEKRSCGCLARETSQMQFVTHGHTVGKKSSTYGIWSQMIQRCRNPKDKSFSKYGARGIRICDRWLRFDNFLEDMGERPIGMSLDRIDNEGNYEPGNCRWADDKAQARNRRSTIFLEYQGKRVPAAELAERHGIPARRLESRVLRFGWSVERALSTPAKSRRCKHYDTGAN